MSEENEVIMAIFGGIYEQRQKQHTHIGQVQWIILLPNFADVFLQGWFIRFALWNSNSVKCLCFTERVNNFFHNKLSEWLVLGSKLWPIQLHLQLNFSPLQLKYLEKSQICVFFSPLLFWNKRVRTCYFAATFTKISKEAMKLFCFLPWIFFQFEASSIMFVA